MLKQVNCVLCNSIAKHYVFFRKRRYYRCSYCRSIMMAKEDQLDAKMEKKRYDQHNNESEDTGYRCFVSPLVKKVTEKFSSTAKGLDYGAGQGPVAASMLGENGYHLELYDPYYYPDKSPLFKNYDFIICSEVIEHFRDPAKEFSILRSLLLPNGSLLCFTEILNDGTTFKEWHYKNDPTHVFFYHEKALIYIKNKYEFSSLVINNRLICFDV